MLNPHGQDDLNRRMRDDRMRLMYMQNGMDWPVGYMFSMPDGSYAVNCQQDLVFYLQRAMQGDGDATFALSYYQRKGWITCSARIVSASTAVTTPPAVPPDGVNVLGNTRIGDPEREKALERLREMHSRGYLGPAEIDARQDAALAALTQPDLDLLVRDLPPPPPASPAVPRTSSAMIPYAFMALAMALAGLAIIMMILSGAASAAPLLALWWFLAGWQAVAGFRERKARNPKIR